MNLQELITVLKKQENNLNDLHKVMLDKQNILINGDDELLNTSLIKEEKLLLKIQLTEENRLEIMQKLFEKYEIDHERYKLEILIEGLKDKVNDKIIKGILLIEKRIKNIISEVTKVNSQNMLLIQQSRNLINETIRALINSSNRSIVDRKG